MPFAVFYSLQIKGPTYAGIVFFKILQQTHTVYTTFSSLLCRWTDCRCMKYNLVLVEASSIVGQRGRLQQNRYLK